MVWLRFIVDMRESTARDNWAMRGENGENKRGTRQEGKRGTRSQEAQSEPGGQETKGRRTKSTKEDM